MGIRKANSMGIKNEIEIAKSQINLRVLSKYDQHISKIIETTSHVVLYDFDMQRQEWVSRQEKD